MKVTRRIGMLLGIAVAVLPLFPWLATGQSWPQRSVKFIVPLAPSSGADITARLLAERLQSRWGQSVVVENRAGGDGMIGITAFLGAHDDHTLLFGPSAAYTAHPYMRTTIPYNADDIIPIVRTTVTVVSIAVPASLGVNSLREFVDLAKRRPGKLNWSAVTGLNDFQLMAFVKEADIDVVRVPYRDVVQAVNDLGENRIQIYSAAYASVRPLVESGKLKVVALTNTTRFETIAPGVPAAKEAGFPALEFDGLVGIFGTKLVPAAAHERIEKDTLESLKDSSIAAKVTASGTGLKPGTTAEFVASIEIQKAVAAQTAKFLGLKPAQ